MSEEKPVTDHAAGSRDYVLIRRYLKERCLPGDLVFYESLCPGGSLANEESRLRFESVTRNTLDYSLWSLKRSLKALGRDMLDALLTGWPFYSERR